MRLQVYIELLIPLNKVSNCTAPICGRGHISFTQNRKSAVPLLTSRKRSGHVLRSLAVHLVVRHRRQDLAVLRRRPARPEAHEVRRRRLERAAVLHGLHVQLGVLFLPAARRELDLKRPRRWAMDVRNSASVPQTAVHWTQTGPHSPVVSIHAILGWVCTKNNEFCVSLLCMKTT